MQNKISKKLVNYLYENISKVEEKFPSINYGGCGSFAVILYNKLKELGLNPKCIIISDRDLTHKEIVRNGLNEDFNRKINRCNSMNELDEFIFLAHVILQVDKWYIDSTGVYENLEDLDYDAYGMVYVPVEFETLERIEQNPIGWSSRYNRCYTPKVKELVDELFEQYA